MSKPAYLILETGRIFEGKFFGAERDTIGEIVFTTGMTGYLETLTDSSYFGQIILQTFPLIGNYGIISSDFENFENSSGQTGASAYIVKSWCEEPSNFRSEGNLDTFLKSKNITGLYGIDTREVAKIIRETGVMNAKITDNINNIDFEEIKNYKITNAIKNVSCENISQFVGARIARPQADGRTANGRPYKVVLIDYGMKESIKQKILNKNCDVWVVPYNTTAEKIKNINPDGIILSDGPGDPADESNLEIINNLKEIIKLNIPVFGICLGHQLLALANNFKTQKLKYGHRGANQPVRDLHTGRIYITSQNHGYEVAAESIDKNIAELWFENVNDKTCEGIEYINAAVFSSQFHPDDCDGSHGTGFLFGRFIDSMEKRRNI
ncbi:MAG: carbamoyl phosphate synthase small subunit [Oscillospiraceae bacterium]|nr:carbamoyl phosphate synthase small subunit [Oscillospiraceae bacterium]